MVRLADAVPMMGALASVYGLNGISPMIIDRLEASGVPTVVLLDANGKYLFHLSGFHSASDLRPVLAYVAEGAYRTQSLRSYLRDRWG